MSWNPEINHQNRPATTDSQGVGGPYPLVRSERLGGPSVSATGDIYMTMKIFRA